MSLSPAESLPNPEDLGLATPLSLMTDEFRESMVARVLSHRSQLPPYARDKLNSILNDAVTISQFPRFPSKAPPPILKQAVLRDLHGSDCLMTSVLKTWFASHRSLQNLVVEHLRKTDLVVDVSDLENYRFNSYWSYDEWTSYCDRIVESHEDLNEDDVAFMVCYVTGKVPTYLGNKLEDEKQPLKSDILQETLAYLKKLAANSPEWEIDVPNLLSAIDELSEEKAAERAAVASRQHLITTLAEFQDQYFRQLEYFELDISIWSAPTHINTLILAEAHDLLERLSGFIDEYSSIPEIGSSLTETRLLNQKRQELEERMLRVKSELDQLLPTDTGQDDHPHKPPSDTSSPAQNVKTQVPEVSEVSTDATLSDLHLSDGVLEFDPTTLYYAVILQNCVDSLVIDPVPNVETATVDVSLESPGSDSSSCVQADVGRYRIAEIGVGQTIVSVTVTAEDGAARQTYILSVQRTPSDVATLKRLDSTAGNLEFDPARIEYSIDLADGVNDMTVTFKPTHASATVMATVEHQDGSIVDVIVSEDGICDISDLEPGQSTLSLAVTAEDDVTGQTYRVTMIRRCRSTLDYTALMWSLVAKDDLAGAFWISKSLTAKGLVSPQLPLLLRAAQAARWLSPESRDFVEDLFTTVSKTDTSFVNDAYVMLGLAASIQPSVIAPETNLLAWLATPKCLPSLESIVSPVRNFASSGQALRPEYISGDEWYRHLHRLIEKTNSDARTWLEDSNKRSHKLPRANKIWRQLCTDGGMLTTLLSAVAYDKRSELATVKSDVEALNQETYRSEVISETDRSLRSNPGNDIAGAARDWLHHGITHACSLAARWCELAEKENEALKRPRNQWLSNHVAELRTKIEIAREPVFDDLSRFISNPERNDLAASALCLKRSIHRLLGYLSIDNDGGHLSPLPPVVAHLLKKNQNAGFSERGVSPNSQIEAALSTRLIWIPNVVLGDDGLPVNAGAPIDLEGAETDWFSSDITLDAVVRSRTRNGDYRFLDFLSSEAATENPVNPTDTYSTELATARETLKEHLKAARESVEQAANDGVIEFEGARWSELMHSLDDIVIERILNCKEAHDNLEEIEVSVKKERIKRREELYRDWEKLVDDLREDTSLEQGVLEQLSSTFTLASRGESLNIRVMEDCVSRVRNYRSGDRQDLVLAGSESSHGTLEEFLRYSRGIGDVLPHLRGSNGLTHLLLRFKGEE